jgi:DNA ligase D-like protein (predicted 3'-phosphoesterase)
VTRDKLQCYRDRRDFKRSPEPDGRSGRKPENRTIFVIQKHDASRMHYDFRLAVDGVLKSWAVPKGPSLDPGVKRLAVATEDHPLDYADFEGVIPEGEYGGGTVLVWDAGTYKNCSRDDHNRPMSAERAIAAGKLSIELWGRKLGGRWALIRMERGGDNDKDQWLLIKERDEAADARRNPVSTEPRSVLSGRTLKEIREEHGGGDEDSGE